MFCSFSQAKLQLCHVSLLGFRPPGHSKHFGEFSFEFEPTNLRAFGVLPAFYLTAPLPAGKFIHGAGGWVLRLLVECREVFSELYERKHGDDKEFVNRVFPPGATSIEELMFSIQAVLNLYYPTEDLSHPQIRELGYYKQREWKIVPNFAINNQWIYPKVKEFPDVQAELLKLNPTFFEKPLFTTKAPRVEECLMFQSLQGVPIMNYANRLLVPREVVAIAATMVKDLGFGFPVEAV
jgi:hypothetical protein